MHLYAYIGQKCKIYISNTYFHVKRVELWKFENTPTSLTDFSASIRSRIKTKPDSESWNSLLLGIIEH